ncbi:MAG: ribosome small subunit-dependent GTPase A [Treponema sp.]|jgi:ribosome biogenesis GTPase|nr:ribosome small subunit-dependent GTPase A [Treponema sp.]
MTGLVIRGSRNVFTIRPEDAPAEEKGLECRLKGKILKGMEGYYNPLAPGDRVAVEAGSPGMGQILDVLERRSLLVRFNQKGQKPQILAANPDRVLCVTSPLSPPFRPRFLDRILIQAEVSGVIPLILCNKYDLVRRDGPDPDTEERLEDYRRIGYDVLRISAETGEGLGELRARMAGKTSVLLGQSGVGKSSLINSLCPELNMRTGILNEKYDRGNHTTSLSELLEFSAGSPWEGPEGRIRVIDTPGIRRMVPWGVRGDTLILYMKEFAALAGKCTYGLSCSHRTEPGCKILEAVAAGVIHEDRYESFLRIRDDLEAL